MGGAAKKEFRPIGGVPVLALAIRPFLSAGFERIVVTLPAGRLGDASALLAPFLDVATLTLVEGGATRQESVRLGLRALAADPPDLVLIHDGARPWLAPDLLACVAEAAERFGACVPVVEVTEAVKEVGLPTSLSRPTSGHPQGGSHAERDGSPWPWVGGEPDVGGTDGTAAAPGDAQLVRRHLPRRHLRFAQTPQGFSYPRIVAAHERARAEGLSFVDDAEVFDRFAGPVAWVPGDPSNRKITFSDDLEEAP
jgi:2-C-methyl-D-erythritol 4-phosphate cytidylyltransferase